jgi:hypothetical protein
MHQSVAAIPVLLERKIAEAEHDHIFVGARRAANAREDGAARMEVRAPTSAVPKLGKNVIRLTLLG